MVPKIIPLCPQNSRLVSKESSPTQQRLPLVTLGTPALWTVFVSQALLHFSSKQQ